jgi:transcriptional regulator with XRE-family HTH domain
MPKPKPRRPDFGPAVRHYRTALGLSKPALCRLSGVGLSTLKRIEAGSLPTLSNLWALAVALGVDLADLLVEHCPDGPNRCACGSRR